MPTLNLIPAMQEPTRASLGRRIFPNSCRALSPPTTTTRLTKFLQGNANRYYRAGQTAAYVRDKFQFRSNLSLTAGLRFDWDGGLTEKYGRIFNFDPSLLLLRRGHRRSQFQRLHHRRQQQSVSHERCQQHDTDWAAMGASATCGRGLESEKIQRQTRSASRHRIYYDRGELYSYLSPGFAEGVINGGPFGVNQTPPYVNAQACSPSSESFYEGFIPTCPYPSYSFSNPWGSGLGPAPSGNPADINYLPNTGVPGTGIAAGIAQVSNSFRLRPIIALTNCPTPSTIL
jgi:hypothetical protein